MYSSVYYMLPSKCSFGLFFLTIGSVCSPQASWPCAWPAPSLHPPELKSSHVVPEVQKSALHLGGPYSFLLLARVAAMHTHVFAFVCAFFPSLLDSDSTFITVVQISAVQSKYWVGYTFPEWIQNHQEIFRLGETGILLKCECAIFLI